MRKNFITLIIAVFFTILYGCASTSSINSTLAPTVPLDNFKTVLVNVQSNVEDSEKETATFKNMLIAELSKNNKWEVVTVNAAKGQLELSATITKLNKVGGVSRILLGGLAGRASVDVDVVLKDSNGNVISQFSANGKSSGGTVFAGGTDQALGKTAEQIVAFMENMK
jgi:flagellar hook-basal body complex protein FliE